MQLAVDGHIELVNERGSNQRQGIFYTPDWVVVFLIRETLEPLLEEIEQSDAVRRAQREKSTERQHDNSFAFAVLNLNLVDPAMGSGHFLHIVDFPACRRTAVEGVTVPACNTRLDEQRFAFGCDLCPWVRRQFWRCGFFCFHRGCSFRSRLLLVDLRRRCDRDSRRFVTAGCQNEAQAEEKRNLFHLRDAECRSM